MWHHRIIKPATSFPRWKGGSRDWRARKYHRRKPDNRDGPAGVITSLHRRCL